MGSGSRYYKQRIGSSASPSVLIGPGRELSWVRCQPELNHV